jgi:ABC-2 type transport system ATP-binding protein
VSEAKRLIPRRVVLETEDDVTPLRELREVASLRQLAAMNGHAAPVAPGQWELELREQADPQVILQACFAQRIRLRSFNQSEPTLHDVFMRLVGPEAREAVFR